MYKLGLLLLIKYGEVSMKMQALEFHYSLITKKEWFFIIYRRKQHAPNNFLQLEDCMFFKSTYRSKEKLHHWISLALFIEYMLHSRTNLQFHENSWVMLIYNFFSFLSYLKEETWRGRKSTCNARVLCNTFWLSSSARRKLLFYACGLVTEGTFAIFRNKDQSSKRSTWERSGSNSKIQSHWFSLKTLENSTCLLSF